MIQATPLLEPHETKSQRTNTTPNRGQNLPNIPRTDRDRESQLDGEQPFRHSGWSRNRQRVDDALYALQVPDKRLDRFRSCGSNAWVLKSQTREDAYRISCDRCRDRFCVPCAKERSRIVAANVHDHIKDRTTRFITLTLRSSEDDLAACVSRLYKCFGQLKRRKFWSCSQAGGAVFLEIKWSPDRGQWHPHLHVISEGKYMDQRELAAQWNSITGDSFIVDIRIVRQSRDAAKYVAKYASKGLGGCYMHDQTRLREAIQCLSKRRLLATFGTWRGLKLLEQTLEDSWSTLGNLNDFIYRARRGDEDALLVLLSLGLETLTALRYTQCQTPGPSP